MKSLEERYLEAGLPTVEGGLQFSRPLTEAEMAIVSQVNGDMAEDSRVSSIDFQTTAHILAAIGISVTRENFQEMLNVAQIRQINMASRGNILARKERLDALNETEAATLSYLLEFWDFIEATRAHGRDRKANPALPVDYPDAPVKPENVIV